MRNSYNVHTFHSLELNPLRYSHLLGVVSESCQHSKEYQCRTLAYVRTDWYDELDPDKLDPDKLVCAKATGCSETCIVQQMKWEGSPRFDGSGWDSWRQLLLQHHPNIQPYDGFSLESLLAGEWWTSQLTEQTWGMTSWTEKQRRMS